MAYFDNNATTRPCEVALAAYSEALSEDWRNPSAPSSTAARVRVKLDLAREKLAACLGVSLDTISFTSGATESNNAVFSHISRHTSPHARVLLSPVEHPSVREAANLYFTGRVDVLPADDSGIVDPSAIAPALDASEVALVSVMAANNETGVVQHWEKIAGMCRAHGIPFHCDATQWVGKLPSSKFDACDYLSASAHKFGGLKGVGVLKSPAEFSFIVGGEQEGGNRAGTENFPGVAAMLAALEESESFVETPILEKARNEFEESLRASIPGIEVLGESVPRLWNVSALLMPSFDNLRWVGKLEKMGHEVSTGSACATGKDGPSHVSAAMGLSPEQARRVVRVSGSRETTPAEWSGLADAFRLAYAELRADSSSSEVVSI
jgi:cysteine desulfurase